jgi:ApaG protein
MFYGGSLAFCALRSQAKVVAATEQAPRGIRIMVRTSFDVARSDPKHNRWFFAYTIRIENKGSSTVQLLNRYWNITDAQGRVEQVRGPGVVGEQPVIEPGSAFEYTSGCPLTTPFGSMHGTYEMTDLQGEHFEVPIPAFALRLPGTMN